MKRFCIGFFVSYIVQMVKWVLVNFRSCADFSYRLTCMSIARKGMLLLRP